MSTLLFLFQRIRELEDKIELQKRQLKEIEEKVNKCMNNANGFFFHTNLFSSVALMLIVLNLISQNLF